MVGGVLKFILDESREELVDGCDVPLSVFAEHQLEEFTGGLWGVFATGALDQHSILIIRPLNYSEESN